MNMNPSTEDKNQNFWSTIQDIFGKIIQFLFASIILVFACGYLYQLWKAGTMGLFSEVLMQHFLASVGIPLAAMAAAALVSVFEIEKSGTINFKFLNIELSGSAGQTILWVISFFAFIAALKILW